MLKVRNRINHDDVFYTLSTWDAREIDGVFFVPVIKKPGIREIPRLMRKDILEYIK